MGEAGPTPPSAAYVALAASTAAVLAFQMMPQRQDTQEITFSDFRRELLESGTVDRIVIVNKTKARVYVRTHSGPPGARVPQSEAQYWFALGSVGHFEKKLELAQASGARDEAEHKLRALVRETEAETNEALGGF